MDHPDPVTDVWELLWTAACDYRDANPRHRSESRLIDALMPVVKAYGDARAVEELRAAADIKEQGAWATWRAILRDRANALDPT